MPRLQLNYRATISSEGALYSGSSNIHSDEEDDVDAPSAPPPTSALSLAALSNHPTPKSTNVINGFATVKNGNTMPALAAPLTFSAVPVDKFDLGYESRHATSSSSRQEPFAFLGEKTRWGTSIDVLPLIPNDGQRRPVNDGETTDGDVHVDLPDMSKAPHQVFVTEQAAEEGIAGLNSFSAFEKDESLAQPPLPPFPVPEDPVVPRKHAEQLANTNSPIDWALHESSQIVSSLLHFRGAMLPTHRMLFEYHMAESFLDCLGVLREGSYFIYYQSKSAAPKERYFRVEMGDDGNGRLLPFLNWYIHRDAVGLADRVPLTNLVGVTPNHRSSVFRFHMVDAQTIVGCFSGDTRLRLSASGCFTLWFWDPYYGIPRSVDLVTTNPLAHALWVMAMRGILSVNSVAIGAQKSDLSAQLLQAQSMLSEEIQR